MCALAPLINCMTLNVKDCTLNNVYFTQCFNIKQYEEHQKACQNQFSKLRAISGIALLSNIIQKVKIKYKNNIVLLYS